MVKTNKKVVKKTAKTIKRHSNLDIPILDLRGEEKDSFKLPKEIFQVETKPSLFAYYIRIYLANQRQGTVSTKTREEVTGSTRKIYRQKGTGRARHGDIKAPIFVGGGVAHGPKPRDFSLEINKKQKRKVFFASLTLKNKEGKLLLVDDEITKIKPKTKEADSWIKRILKKDDIKRQKITIVLPKIEKNNFVLAVRNLPQVNFLSIENLNPFIVLKSDYIIFLKSALDRLIKVFLKKQNEDQ